MRISDWSSDVCSSDLAPRARAFAMLGAAAIQDAHPGHGQSKRILEEFGEQLLAMLHISRRPDWAWFEAVLSYDNARLPETLLRAGTALGRTDFIERSEEHTSELKSLMRNSYAVL